jgi:alpha-ribazole phosphatase CobZ
MKRYPASHSFESEFRKYGITFEAMVDTALDMYIYDPRIGSKSKVRAKVIHELKKALGDINIACLVSAAFYLESSGPAGAIPGISAEKYASDPVDLLADEIIGQSIATYLAGTRALFEFERIDKLKPGILKKLPPMLDDMVAGLISGVMVKVCS